MTQESKGQFEVVRREGSATPQVLPEQLILGVSASEKAFQKTQTGYTTAVSVQKPRELSEVAATLLHEAEFAGETFFYVWGEGKNHVEGGSVGLATAAARAWGNCAINTEVEETANAYNFKSYFIDLERGYTISRTFRQSKKWVVYGDFDDIRKEDIRFQIGQSKSIRNVVSAALPDWLLGQAIERAKSAVISSIGKIGLAKSIERAFETLERMGISEERVLAKVNKKDRLDLTPDDIVDLRTAVAAINSGEEYASRIFPGVKGAKQASSRITKQQDKPTAKDRKANNATLPDPENISTGFDLDKKIEDTGVPVSRDDIQAYFAEQGKLKAGQKFEDNAALVSIAEKNFESLASKVADWISSLAE